MLWVCSYIQKYNNFRNLKPIDKTFVYSVFEYYTQIRHVKYQEIKKYFNEISCNRKSLQYVLIILSIFIVF